MSGREWQLVIPAPARWLSLNDRRDRRAETPDRREWRRAGWAYAKQAKLPRLDRVHIDAELRFTDRRERDAHNYAPTWKAVVDGLVDAGLVADDSTKYLAGPFPRIGDPLPRVRGGIAGALILTIREIAP